MISIAKRFLRWSSHTNPASSTARRVALGIAVVVLAAVPVVIDTAPVGVSEGKPAPRTYRANRQVQYEDSEATEKLRQAARDSVKPVTRFDPDALREGREAVRTFFALVESEPVPTAGREPTATSEISEITGLEQETARMALEMDETERRETARITEELVSTLLTGRFSDEALPDTRMRLVDSANILRVTSVQRQVIGRVGSAALRPTIIEDEAATEAARHAAAEEVPPVVVVKQPGENIVVKGEIVTARHLDIMANLGLLDKGGDAVSIAAVLVLLMLLVGSTGAYLFRYEPEVYGRMRDLLIVATLFVGMVGITRGTLWLWPEASPFVMPVPLAAMLATLLISPRIGLLVTVMTTAAGMLLGFTTGLNVVAVFVTSLVAVVAMSSLTQRRHLVYAGVVVVVAASGNALIATLAGGAGLEAAGVAAAYGTLGGVLASVLAYGLLPFFEHLFGVTTDVRLLELSSPSQPLLKRLMTEASGTYSHSVLAGSLAETAADAIGANPLLARVGAYYHDVGKLARPAFFSENINGAVNPHDSASPETSVAIITAHVKDGDGLAEEYKLPPEVREIIRQHHGDSLVTFFYSKASVSGRPVYEADFRYPGERPRSKEAALVMLADTVEAAVRAVGRPNGEEVEAAVRKVIKEKVADGQLDESELTLADIEEVVKVYAAMLMSIYHPRVKYPEPPTGRSEHAGQRYEPSRA